MQVNSLLAALRTHRDWAMVLGGLRRCEVLGLRLRNLHVAGRRVFIAEGKGGHQRLIPVSGRFFTSVASYLDVERPADADTDRVFLVLKAALREPDLPTARLEGLRATYVFWSTIAKTLWLNEPVPSTGCAGTSTNSTPSGIPKADH